MTNKPMLSVDRELLEEMLAAMKETYSLPAKYYGSTLGDRVRAILESQNEQAEPLAIGTLHRDCDERIVFESSGEIHIKDGMQVYAAPAAQRKGDPVALYPRCTSLKECNVKSSTASGARINDIAKPITRRVCHGCVGLPRDVFCPVCDDEQPAPVTVVMPDFESWWADTGEQLTKHEVGLKDLMQCAYEARP